jgi:hypothetical protein
VRRVRLRAEPAAAQRAQDKGKRGSEGQGLPLLAPHPRVSTRHCSSANVCCP